MDKFKLLAAIFISILMLSSCGQPSGSAPSPINIVAPTNYKSLVKYGETKISSNLWTVGVVNSDPVEVKTLANGWTVEVVDE